MIISNSNKEVKKLKLEKLKVKKSVKRKLNKKLFMEGRKMLGKLDDESIRIGFFDPQYPLINDREVSGSARQQKRLSLPWMSYKVINNFIKEYERVLAPSGFLFLWTDARHLLVGIDNWMKGSGLIRRNLIVWDKGKMGLGFQVRRQCEYLIILQKQPEKIVGVWNDFGIREVWSEKYEQRVKNQHPHKKPGELICRLIKASTLESDIVVDAAAGSFSVLNACRLVNRNFLGCDIMNYHNMKLNWGKKQTDEKSI